MAENTIELSRRKLLASATAVGVAGAGAGLGTSALFSDTEQFGNNRVVAGQLDMRVAWESYYSDWSVDEGNGVDIRMEDGGPVEGDRVGLPTSDAALVSVASESDARTFLENAQVGSYPGDYDPLDPPADPCSGDALGDADASPPLIEIEDAKPGDFGSVTFDFALCDNPGFVWLRGRLLDADENGTTEPEAESAGEQEGTVELLDAVRAAAWVDDGNGFQDGGEALAFSGSLRNVLNGLAAGDGLGLSGDIAAEDGGGRGRNCFSAKTTHSVVLAWWVPASIGNAVQSDSARFEVGFYTEQCRHNAASSANANYLPQSKLFPASGSTNDEYGRAVAVDGDTAVVGAPNGSVYVLERTGETWVHATTLKEGASGDVGASVTIDGDAVLFSAPNVDEAYVYARDGDGDGWTGMATLEPSDSPTSFGYEDVALDGSTAVVSGYDAAYVYERSSGGWPGTESSRLETGNDLPADGLALGGDTLLVGAPAVDGMRAGGPGKVYVYGRDGTGWSEQAELGSGTFENFGSAVALDGDTAVVGASVAGGSGAAYVYDRSGWTEVATLAPSDGESGDEFGHTVALRDGTALVGAPDADASAAGSGAAYVFDGADGWPGTETQKLVPTDGESGDGFGSGLALGNTAAFVGAEEGDGAADDSGAVYVFSP